MSEFSDKEENHFDWYNHSFYTHNNGYKMALGVVSKDVKGIPHLSVYLHLMKGPHDGELTWPLMGKFEIKLLNQINDSEHYSYSYNNLQCLYMLIELQRVPKPEVGDTDSLSAIESPIRLLQHVNT